MPFYKDVNTYYPTQKPSVNDVEAIGQSLLDLILTRPGERPFNPDYGINADALLFELMTDGADLQLLNEIIEKVRRYEPRVTLNTAQTNVEADPDNNEFNISLIFEIVGFEGTKFEVSATIRG